MSSQTIRTRLAALEANCARAKDIRCGRCGYGFAAQIQIAEELPRITCFRCGEAMPAGLEPIWRYSGVSVEDL